MSWPADPIAADKADDTATPGDHADHHNELAAALNALRGKAEPMASSPWSSLPGARVGSDTDTEAALIVTGGDFDSWDGNLAMAETTATTSPLSAQAFTDWWVSGGGENATVRVGADSQGRAELYLEVSSTSATVELTSEGLQLIADALFFGPPASGRGPVPRPTITGSLSSNLADVVADLLEALHDLGIITDGTTA